MIGNKTEKEGRNMINPVTPNQVINEVQTPEVEKNRQYVSMRGNKLERISSFFDVIFVSAKQAPINLISSGDIIFPLIIYSIFRMKKTENHLQTKHQIFQLIF